MGLNNKTNLKSQASTIRHEDKEGLNTAERVGKVLEEIIDATDASLTTESSTREQRDNALTQQLSIASNTAIAAHNVATEAKTTANKAKSDLQAHIASQNAAMGAPNGIAPLDANAKVPAANLPGYVDDVIEFNAMVSGVTVQKASIPKNSTDAGCMVVYDTESNRFMLAVSNLSVNVDQTVEWDSVKRPIKTLNTPSTSVVNGEASPVINVGDYWQVIDGNVSLIREKFTYYNNWLDGDSFGVESLEGRIPQSGKVYICTSDNKTFRWSGSELVTIGSDLALGHTANTAFPGDEGADLQENVSYLQAGLEDANSRLYILSLLPADGFWSGKGMPPRSGVWLVPSPDGGVYFASFGDTNFYGFAEEEYNSDMTYTTGHIYRIGDCLYRIVNDKFESLAGSAVGNTYNATVELPLATGEYYSDILTETQTNNVLQAVYEAGKASLGITITFAIGPGSWKTYQYVGPNTTKEQFVDNVANWIDLAGMSAGAEAICVLAPKKVLQDTTRSTQPLTLSSKSSSHPASNMPRLVW